MAVRREREYGMKVYIMPSSLFVPGRIMSPYRLQKEIDAKHERKLKLEAELARLPWQIAELEQEKARAQWELGKFNKYGVK